MRNFLKQMVFWWKFSFAESVVFKNVVDFPFQYWSMQATVNGEFPWMVALLQSGAFLCGGTLIRFSVTIIIIILTNINIIIMTIIDIIIEIEVHGLWWQRLTVFLAFLQLNWQPGRSWVHSCNTRVSNVIGRKVNLITNTNSPPLNICNFLHLGNFWWSILCRLVSMSQGGWMGRLDNSGQRAGLIISHCSKETDFFALKPCLLVVWFPFATFWWKSVTAPKESLDV